VEVLDLLWIGFFHVTGWGIQFGSIKFLSCGVTASLNNSKKAVAPYAGRQAADLID